MPNEAWYEPDEPFEFTCIECGEYFWSRSPRYCDEMVETGDGWMCAACFENAKTEEGER